MERRVGSSTAAAKIIRTASGSKELQKAGLLVGERRIGRLMKSVGISGISPRRFRKTTDSGHALPIAENVLGRNFDIDVIGGPNRVWTGDITYLQTREGWLYLAVVIDMFSRRVAVGR